MPDNTLHFTIALDDAALKPIGVNSVDDIMAALKSFAELQYNL